ncbi:response regulator [Flagellimonas sp. 389]|uniref:response regulator n=1 Tax=Flagellimonas sp. 389 TaxID=2835862 RepID=UPI001BD1F7DE|nr:response regulator [Flagellimonas sp. 389]MBS9461429.1 response regulator [Flagellimonas sp. 389]
MTEKTPRILIVEDDYRLATEWQDTLMAKGYHVDTVPSADEANLLLTNNYDYFILDLFHVRNNEFLPDGGIKCIGQIRRYEAIHNKNSLIIAVTGYFRHEKEYLISTDRVAKNLGADFTLEKPVNISSILGIIENGG